MRLHNLSTVLIGIIHVVGLTLAVRAQDWALTAWIVTSSVWFGRYEVEARHPSRSRA